MIFRCYGFRRLGKPSSSLKVTFINDVKRRSFSKIFKKIINGDRINKSEQNLRFGAQVLFKDVEWRE
ncbi:hypothetical protein CJ419_23910 [Vibrio navarrensis]|nr:hypothetical protein [Vibrio navarrensis]